jgi:NHL repeat
MPIPIQGLAEAGGNGKGERQEERELVRRQARAVSSATRRGSLGLIAVLAVFAAGLIGVASPALAITEGHSYSFSFGTEGSGNGQFVPENGQGVAVDQDSGDIYVADTNHSRVEKFDSSGAFLAAWGYGVQNGGNVSQVCNAPAICQVGLRGAAPGQFENPTALAVDNSGGPNDGDVYVADTGNAYGAAGVGDVLKFTSTGVYLSKIDGEDTPGGAFGGLPWNGAIAVDAQGFLYVTTGGRILKFDNTLSNEYVGGSEWTSDGLFSLGVNSTGAKLMATGYVPSGNESSYLVNTNGTAPGPALGCGSYFSGDIGFDMTNGHFLVGAGNSICEFTQSGELVGEPFGSAHLGSVGGIAVREATGAVYVVDWAQARVSVFLPRVVAEVKTEPAKDVGRTTATLTGHVTPDPSGGGPVVACHFELGTATSYGTNVPCTPATPYASGTGVTADVSGLTADTTYHFRLVASNSVDANFGKDQTFTPHRVLGLSTVGATNIAPTTVTLNGSFDPDAKSTHYFFEWGKNTSYGNATAVSPGVDAPDITPGTKTVSTNISGLTNYTEYHYRIVASNELGTSYGEDMSLRTAPPEPPAVSETAVSAVTNKGAHLSAQVNPSLGLTVYKFQYGPDSSYGSETLTSGSIGEDNVNRPVAADLTKLAPGTTYHVRVVATNFGGTTLGPDMTFTTTNAPTVDGSSVSDIGASGASLHARVKPGLSPTAVHFEYGTTASLGSSTPDTAIGADNSSHAVGATLGELAPATTYHFRVVAVNGVGVTRGADQTFTTGAAPAPPPPPPAPRCKKGFVKKHGSCVRKPKHKKHHRKTSNRRAAGGGR